MYSFTKRIGTAALLSVLCMAGYATTPGKHVLWYKSPARSWMTSCLPIGNGQFGATLMGGVMSDDIQFNDKTLWTACVGKNQDNAVYGRYLDFGHVKVTQLQSTDSVAYMRSLDLDNAVATVRYSSGGATYTREYIASFPDDVVAVHYVSTLKGGINVRLQLCNTNGKESAYRVKGSCGYAEMSGAVKRFGQTSIPESYYAGMRVVVKGGKTKVEENGLLVNGATEMTIYLRGMTNYSPDNDLYISDASKLPGRVNAVLDHAQAKGYKAIRQAHIADYRNLAERCQLNLTDQPNNLPTPNLINEYNNNPSKNLLLEELYFTYGRYLLIGSSRGVDLPNNLQGIWNALPQPGWNSDIHSDINVEMNYWPAEVTNLSQLHMPYLNYIYREACQRSQWHNNAHEMAGINKGWTVPVENNIYGSGSTWMNNYTVANAWYCMHLWQHWRYTLDREYLRNTAFPAMKSCCDFWLASLVKAKDGTWECPDQYSPEHGPDAENATAHSQQLVWNLFNNTLQAIDILGEGCVDKAFVDNLKEKFSHLDRGIAIEEVDGEKLLREWKYTNQATVWEFKDHRHLSHLMSLYPGDELLADSNRVYYEAAVNSLNHRGYEGTGWSLAWKIALFARARDAQRCHQLIQRALRLTDVEKIDMSGVGGIYENLWDAHPPFQIDGNFGTPAAMAEMLLQSCQGRISLLPTLPKVWNSGYVNGLRAENAFGVDIAWQDGKLTYARIVSDAGHDAVIEYPGAASNLYVTNKQGKKIDTQILTENRISFATTVGGEYLIKTK